MDINDFYNKLKKTILYDDPLVMTGYQRRSAIDNKSIFLAYINPLDFILATSKHTDDQLNFLCNKTEEIEFYNDLHRQNQIAFPFLMLEKELDKIVTHEGRSRMLRSLMAGHKKVPVFIKTYWRLDDEEDIKPRFPLIIEYQEIPDMFIEIKLSDVIEFHPMSEWKGY